METEPKVCCYCGKAFTARELERGLTTSRACYLTKDQFRPVNTSHFCHPKCERLARDGEDPNLVGTEYLYDLHGVIYDFIEDLRDANFLKSDVHSEVLIPDLCRTLKPYFVAEVEQQARFACTNCQHSLEAACTLGLEPPDCPFRLKTESPSNPLSIPPITHAPHAGERFGGWVVRGQYQMKRRANQHLIGLRENGATVELVELPKSWGHWIVLEYYPLENSATLSGKKDDEK